MRLGLKLRQNELIKKNVTDVLYKNKRIKVKVDLIYVLMKLLGMI